MLDERGVEWRQSVNMLGCVFTRWYSPLFSDEVVAMENGDGELELFSHLMTPEQAVEATLGDADATGERQRDAVEVVRCRDCEHFAVDQSDHDYRTGWWCKRWYTDMVKPDGFCAWGERRDA